MSHSVDLTAYGWNNDVADAFSPYEDEGFVPARIARVTPGDRCEAVTASGTVWARTAPARTVPSAAPQDRARAVRTGDWAALATGGSGEPEVRALLPRRTAFVRRAASPGATPPVLAANVDHALIAASLADGPDLGRVERLVSLAWASGAQPLIVLTKADLVPGGEALARRVSDAESAAGGVRALAVSAHDGAGIGELRAAVAGGTSVLVGPRGVGASRLTEALLGELPGQRARRSHPAGTARTHPAGTARDRGDPAEPGTARTPGGAEPRATGHRALLPLPAPGGVLIDTPELRRLGDESPGDRPGRPLAEGPPLPEGCGPGHRR